MTVVSVPAGWYRDPSTRHEQRYWDGQHWSSHVLDGPVASVDPPAETPVPGLSAVAAVSSRRGYRAVRINALRYAAGYTAFLLLFVAWLFEVLSFLIAFGISARTSDEDFLRVFTWLYTNPGSLYAQQYIGRPPVLLLLAMIVIAVVTGTAINGTRSEALKKAGGRAAHWLWASPDHKAQWAYAKARLAGAGVRFTVGARTRDYVYVVVGLLGSLLIAGIGWLAISERSALDVTGELVGGLKVGFGPYVCLAAGVAGVIGALALWPFGRRIVINADGSVEEPPA